jgi:hypothetical protein
MITCIIIRELKKMSIYLSLNIVENNAILFIKSLDDFKGGKAYGTNI